MCEATDQGLFVATTTRRRFGCPLARPGIRPMDQSSLLVGEKNCLPPRYVTKDAVQVIVAVEQANRGRRHTISPFFEADHWPGFAQKHQKKAGRKCSSRTGKTDQNVVKSKV